MIYLSEQYYFGISLNFDEILSSNGIGSLHCITLSFIVYAYTT